MKNKLSFLAVLFLLFFYGTAFAADSTTPEPYKDGEFPSWVMDLRRSEIITFGSLPFTTIGVSLGYGTYLYLSKQVDSFPNPLNKTTSTFTVEQEKKIVAMAVGVSVIVGITDFIINRVRNRNKAGSAGTTDRNYMIIMPAPPVPEEFRQQESEQQEEGDSVAEESEDALP